MAPATRSGADEQARPQFRPRAASGPTGTTAAAYSMLPHRHTATRNNPLCHESTTRGSCNVVDLALTLDAKQAFAGAPATVTLLLVVVGAPLVHQQAQLQLLRVSDCVHCTALL